MFNIEHICHYHTQHKLQPLINLRKPSTCIIWDNDLRSPKRTNPCTCANRDVDPNIAFTNPDRDFTIPNRTFTEPGFHHSELDWNVADSYYNRIIGFQQGRYKGVTFMKDSRSDKKYVERRRRQNKNPWELFVLDGICFAFSHVVEE